MKSALVVIDVQKGLFEPEPAPFDADLVISRINTLSSRGRKAGVPVVFVQHETADGALSHGAPGWELDPRLQVAPGDHLIRKTTPDSFLRTRLTELLTKLEATHLILCGYATEFCVDTTARRAAGLKYHVTLAADAHTTHDKAHAPADAIRAHHNATLPAIGSYGVPIDAILSRDIVFNEGA
ncbi:cysteine hydrolase family protein [Desulfoluna spongiiphila]|uniref:cysteine hydrolase family protein n=1 Tax=Desulfoluna spongiiphila TaxID=419481 RepID=UPI0012561980|nr:cysteine hydrolase family protein [Desulfoluna spongiiphila]VVS92761.1 isochorismatase-like [Desulfoluna spongiiphila]